MKRLFAACLISPLWVPVFAALWAAWTLPPVWMRGTSAGSWIANGAAVGAVAGYAGIVALGLPAHMFLQRRSPLIWAYLATWFGVAVAAWAALFFAGFASNGLWFSLNYLADTIVYRSYVPVRIAAVWALVGATFWLIVRPDR